MSTVVHSTILIQIALARTSLVAFRSAPLTGGKLWLRRLLARLVADADVPICLPETHRGIVPELQRFYAQ